MLPKLNRIRNHQTAINTFKGINQSVNVGFSKISSNSSSVYTEFVNQKNVSCDDYPALSTRKERNYIANDVNITSNIIIANNKICYIKNHDTLVIGDKEVVLSATTNKTENIMLMGSQIIIFPTRLLANLDKNTVEEIDGYYFKESMSSSSQQVGIPEGENAYDHTFRGNIKVRYSSKLSDSVPCCSIYYYITDSGQLKATSSMEDFYSYVEDNGSVERIIKYQKSKIMRVVDVIENTDYLNDHLLKFTELEGNYVSIHQTGIGVEFKIGDYVRISYLDTALTSKSYKEVVNDNSFADRLNDKYFKILDKTDDAIMIQCDLNCSVDYNGPIGIYRMMPTYMDFNIENENRLWGCSNKNNEIYASKLGDPTNWFAYGDGISTDSYALTIGTEGEFTGIAKQNNAILFFKENWVHKIYGTKPSNYCLTTYNVPGVEKGSEKSLVWINGTLFYKSKYGVCLYSPGGTPTIISDEAFGNNTYTNAVAGKYKHKYYISLLNTATNEYELYTYDTYKGIWNREDNTQFLNTVTYNDNLYFTDGKTNYIGSIDGKENLFNAITNSELFYENPIEWEAETGNLYDNELNVKWINQLQFLLELNEKSEVEIFIKTKVNGEYRQIKSLYAQEKRTINYTFVPSRADFLQIKFKGRGQARLYQINIRYNAGSEKRSVKL